MSVLDDLLQLDLFGAPVERSPVIPLPKKKLANAGRGGWELVDHACRECLGRVLVRRHKGKTVEARCAECGAHAHGEIADVCCCGADCGVAGRVLECYANPAVSASVPQEVLVRERVTVERRAATRRANPVGGQGL